jgi:hypothetical protein
VNAAGSPVRPAPALLTRLALGACTLSLAAALYALAFPRGCAACEAAAQFGAGPVIPLLGSLWYAALLSLLAIRGLTRLTGYLAHAGAGVHIGLVCLMAQERAWCVPCLAAAGGAVLLAACAWHSRAVLRRAALGLLVGAALASTAGLYLLSREPRFRLAQELQKAVALARLNGPVAPGAVDLTFFKRDGCDHCAAFARDVLPVLRSEFGDRLRITEVPAWSGIPAPTVVIRGRHEALLYPNPSLATVRRVVAEELR